VGFSSEGKGGDRSNVEEEGGGERLTQILEKKITFGVSPSKGEKKATGETGRVAGLRRMRVASGGNL